LVTLTSTAKLIFGLQQSLDGYVDHLKFRPGPALSRHFMEHVRGLAGSVYGRRTYEIMRYWDEDQPEWETRPTSVGFATPPRSRVPPLALIERGALIAEAVRRSRAPHRQLHSIRRPGAHT
jgi:hypothetical protein